MLIIEKSQFNFGMCQVIHEVYVGSTKNQRIWPAIQKQAQGVIIVFNGDNPKSETDADFWIEKFPKSLNIPINQCVAFSHHVSGQIRDKKQRVLKTATTMKIAQTCIEEGSSTIHPAFNTFMSSLIDSLIEKQAKEEQNLISGNQ